ncbi:MAG: hypothetical protein HY852_11095 [Bradyrhizobium sp.]|uniref:hypothetical protein n=1 Tax=Bradyrhizobium sp. TaxID=376 RepID=UPI0025BD1AE3|nr:hypothetical protein [Bradyrhizobium sp.]MBI5262348.1 hypothetical protein [Bradyrhizobium sp.]
MTSPSFLAFRRLGLAFGAALVVALCLNGARGLAADAPERPFNPPVGSRWIIESEADSRETRPDGNRNTVVTSRAEVTVDEKTSDGFRISYVRRKTTVEGNAPAVALMRTAIQALENVPIRATTDRSGKPIRIDNLDEAKTALRSMAEKITAPVKDKPQVFAMLSQVFAGMIDVDAEKAATTFVDEMPVLAKAQATGMKPGEARRSANVVENPLGGGPLKSNMTLELTQADAASGKRVYVHTTSYDVDSLKEFTQSMSKKLLATAGGGATPAQVEEIVKAMTLSLDQRAVFEVEDGITRKISEKSVTTVRALGQNLQKTENKTITVTRAP